MLPLGSAVLPALPVVFAPGAAPVLWFLVGAGIAVGASVIIVSRRAIAAALEELVVWTTAGTVAEPVGELILEAAARVAAVRWYLADIALAWHPGIGDVPDAARPASGGFGPPALSRAA